MRLLLVGAFAYPHDQGSQVYFQQQALALRAAGAEVEMLSYGPGRSGAADHPLAGMPFHSLPSWAAPVSRRSGPQAAKAFADLCLAVALRRLVARGCSSGSPDSAEERSASASEPASKSASKTASSSDAIPASSASSRFAGAKESPVAPPTGFAERRFDAILAHHAEAALLSLYALPGSRPPVVYCAHTLLENELPEYCKSSQKGTFSIPFDTAGSGPRAPFHRPGAAGAGAPLTAGPGMTQSAMGRLGRVIDRRIAARADGWIALTQNSMRVMSAAGGAPGRLIAPPVPALVDADRERGAPSSATATSEERRRAAAALLRSHGLKPGDYFLYSGNLDPYQDLPLLEAVARSRRGAGGGERIGEPGEPGCPLPIVVATHDERAQAFAGGAIQAGGEGLVVCRLRSAEEANALLVGARASVVPRRSLGGFPIKLANSLAAGIPVVALHGAEWGLVDGRDALIGDLTDPVGSLVRALARLEREPALAARLGEGARATHRRQHDPARVAAETLALVAELVGRRD